VSRIREYDRARDAAGLRACFVELQEYERVLDPELLPAEQIVEPYLERMFERCRSWRGKVFVADVDGALAGFVCVWSKVPQEELDQDPREQAYVSDLVVVAGQRDRGIGRELLQRAEEYARAEGAPALGIGVLARNTGALVLYRELGFSEYLLQLKKNL
jgi:ribosomal protein S18 acetylase RimI-like enzyme